MTTSRRCALRTSATERRLCAPYGISNKIHKGGFYHDGRFATLEAVVEHYNAHLGLGLNDQEKDALIEYLKSI